jgi:hypothetical protein
MLHHEGRSDTILCIIVINLNYFIQRPLVFEFHHNTKDFFILASAILVHFLND